MIVKIEKWRAEDGTEFETEDEADAYELTLARQSDIGAFLDSLDPPVGEGSRKGTEYRRVLSAWIKYEAAQR